MVLQRSVLWQNRGIGLSVSGSSEVSATGTLIEGTRPGERGDMGFGVSADRSRVSMTSSAVVGNHAVGLDANNLGAELTMDECLVEGTQTEESSRAFGRGAQVWGGAQATLTSVVVSANRDAGLFIQENAPGSEALNMTGCLVQDTLVQEIDGQGGMGLYSEDATISVSSSVFRNNVTAGLMLVQLTTAALNRVWVDGVPSGSFSLLTGEHVDGAGDGVLVLRESNVTMSDVDVLGCARAGILYDKSSGSVTTTRALSNRFGLVLQGSQKPTVAEDCVFKDNTERDRIVGGDLAVPDAAPGLP